MKTETIIIGKPAVRAAAVAVTPASRKSLRKDKQAAVKADERAAVPATTATTIARALVGVLSDTFKRTTPVTKAKPPATKADSTAQKGAGATATAPATPAVTKAAKTAQEAAKKVPAALAPQLAPQFVPRKYVAGTQMFSLAEETRPNAKRMLFAHTHAALTILGLLDAKRPVASKTHLITLIGQCAVKYHIGQNNFEDGPNRTIRLSIPGYNKFSGRLAAGAFSHDAATAYQSALLDGKTNPKMDIHEGTLYSCMFK